MLGNTFLHVIKYYLGVEEANTQTSPKEREMLRSLAQNAKKVLEIGVFEGNTTKLMAEVMSSSGVIYGVDPFFSGRIGFSYGLLITQQQIRKARKINKGITINLVKDFSYNVASDQSLGDFDLIFIDGDHSFQGIKQDWNDWSSRVVQGGIMALHDTRVPDYDPSVANLGSFQYFESHIKFDSRFKLIDQVDSLNVLKRI